MFKIKKRIKKRKNHTFTFMILFISFIGVVYSMYGLMVAYHNFDLGQNIKWLNAEYNITLVDTASDGNAYTGEEMYHLGVSYFRSFIWILLTTSLFFGMALNEIGNLALKNSKGEIK